MLRTTQRHAWQTRLGVTVSLLAFSSIVSGIGIPSIQRAAKNTHDETAPGQLSYQNIEGRLSRGYSAIANTSGGRMRGGGFGNDAPSGGSSSGSAGGYSSSYGSDSSYGGNSSGGITISGNFLLVILIIAMVSTRKGRAFLSRLIQDAIKQANENSQQNQRTAAYGNHLQGGSRSTPSHKARHLSSEITNNVVTLTQIQVAMMSEARHVQQTLNQIAADTDLGTPEGLMLGLRETVVTLLRSPETWTHAIATSKTVNTKQEAKERFETLSLEERSKFDVESMVNIDGEVKRNDHTQPTEEMASYIVVTLLVGTAHDSAIIDPVMSTEELKAALKRLGSITPDYLMVYEVLWSPQNEGDSLTDEELLLHYPKMFQL